MDTQVFTIAEAKTSGPMLFRSPDREKEDLTLRPFQPEPIDTLWLKVPHFVRELQAGNVVVTESPNLPQAINLDIAPEFQGKITDTARHTAVQICTSEMTPQFEAVVKLSSHLTKAGTPGKDARRVTRTYLKDTHILFLKATLELEGRLKNRPAIKRVLQAEIKKIEAL